MRSLVLVGWDDYGMKWFVGAAAMVNNGTVEHCGRLCILGTSIFGEDTIFDCFNEFGGI